MVKLEEVVDEEFLREQEGPHDEDEWDTDSGTSTPLRPRLPISSAP
jgi:import receptor subunit TOM22